MTDGGGELRAQSAAFRGKGGGNRGQRSGCQVWPERRLLWGKQDEMNCERGRSTLLVSLRAVPGGRVEEEGSRGR